MPRETEVEVVDGVEFAIVGALPWARAPYAGQRGDAIVMECLTCSALIPDVQASKARHASRHSLGERLAHRATARPTDATPVPGDALDVLRRSSDLREYAVHGPLRLTIATNPGSPDANGLPIDRPVDVAAGDVLAVRGTTLYHLRAGKVLHVFDLDREAGVWRRAEVTQ